MMTHLETKTTGKISKSISGSDSCKSCDAGKYSTAGQSACIICKAGTWSGEQTADDCTVCSWGKYSEADSSSCDGCSNGKYLYDGAQSITDDEPNPPGSDRVLHDSEAKCLECAINFFAKGVQHTCEECPEGSSTSGETGAWSCTSCFSGQDVSNFCQKCEIGEYSSGATMGKCAPCPSGRYEDYSGYPQQRVTPQGDIVDVGSDECDGCPPGKFLFNTTGATNSAQCVECAAGRFALESGTAECEECEAGKYSNQKALYCLDCIIGKYSQAGAAGSINCLDCPFGKSSNDIGTASCENCTAGDYQDEEGKTSCDKCPHNFYTDTPGQKECKACSLGKSSSLGENECYLLESSTDFHECPESSESRVTNKCNYLFAGHWEERGEGETNPFGDKCQNFTIVGHDVVVNEEVTDVSFTKTDEYFLMCANCTGDYSETAFNTAQHIDDLINHVTHDVTLINVDGTGTTVQPGTKPGLCYTQTQLAYCINTNEAGGMMGGIGVDIDCQYLKDGTWSSKDPGQPSPFQGGVCSSYTICDFEQTYINSQVVRDEYFIMCNSCTEGFIPGVTNINLQIDKGRCSKIPSPEDTPEAERFSGYPTKCYNEATSFITCPGYALDYLDYKTNPKHQLEKCKYIYEDLWVSRPDTDISENSVDYASPFGSRCGKHELCDVDTEEIFGGIFQTTYKLACAECAEGYIPTDPIYSRSTSSLGSCKNYRYPTDCFRPADLSSRDIDWSSCPVGTDGHKIDCHYYHDTGWVKKTVGNSASPWLDPNYGDGCKKYNFCARNLTESWESDSYYIMCDECSENFSPNRIVPPSEYFPDTACSGQDKSYPAFCSRNPSEAPSQAPSDFPTQPPIAGATDTPEGFDDDQFDQQSATEQITSFYTGKSSGMAWALTGVAFLVAILGFYKAKKKHDLNAEYDDSDDDDDDVTTSTSESSWADYGNPKKDKRKYMKHDNSDGSDNDSRL